MLRTAILSAAAVIGGALALPAMATTLVFSSPNWDYNTADEVAWRVEIDDDTAGVLTVSIGIDFGSTSTGDILGFGFDTTLTGLTFPDFTGSDLNGSFETDSRSCGSGCNFNGAVSASEAFDYVVGFGSTGSSGGLLTSTSFTIDVDNSFTWHWTASRASVSVHNRSDRRQTAAMGV